MQERLVRHKRLVLHIRPSVVLRAGAPAPTPPVGFVFPTVKRPHFTSFDAHRQRRASKTAKNRPIRPPPRPITLPRILTEAFSHKVTLRYQINSHATNSMCGSSNGWESAAHRDGSPYPLRTRYISDPKEVGSGSCRIPVSRKTLILIFFYQRINRMERIRISLIRLIS